MPLNRRRRSLRRKLHQCQWEGTAEFERKPTNDLQNRIAAHLAEHYSDELLTDREVKVLRHLVDGNRNRDIAEKLFIAEETVKVHMKRIMGKLRANHRTQALAIALRRGLLHL